MLDVETTHQIIFMHFVEGLSVRKIAQKLKIHRKTVTSRIEQYNRFKKGTGAVNGPSVAEIGTYLTRGKTYDSSGREARKITPKIAEVIDKCLTENEEKRLDGRRKQRLRKIDIHEILITAGHQISYSSVCKYIARKEMHAREAFIKQGYQPGDTCEFDWGEVILYIAGNRRRYYLAVFTSAYSGYRYAILFERQNSLAFRESHIVFFSHVGGVWRQMTYDNMRVAVAKFVGKTEKVPTDALLQLSRYYMLQWRFCNTARGNEKGHVERSIEYVRRKVFAFKDEFETFDEAQQYLEVRVLELNRKPPKGAKVSPCDQLREEKRRLLPHPGEMECFDVELATVDNLSTVCIGTNRYSVPDHLVGKRVSVKCYSSLLKIAVGNNVVCTHTRSYEKTQWFLNLNHYLVTLSRKPGAVRDSIALKQAPGWIQKLYKRYFMDAPREFIEVLNYCKENDIDHARLKATVDRLKRMQGGHVEGDHIRALLGNQPETPVIRVKSHRPNAIAAQAMENIAELTSMMG